MAQKVSFDAYLGWVNITNPNQIPADARVIGANDLLRYEKLGKDTAAKFAEVDQTLDGMKSDVVISDLIADTNSETRYAVDGMVKDGVAKFQKVIDEVPGKVEAQVTPLVAKAIAADSTVTSAAKVAVDTQIRSADLVRGEDDRIPELMIEDENGPVFSVTDQSGRRSWLEVGKDGGMTASGAQRAAESLASPLTALIDGIPEELATSGGYAFAITDEVGRIAFGIREDGTCTVSPSTVTGPTPVTQIVGYGTSMMHGSSGAGTTLLTALASELDVSTGTLINMGRGGMRSPGIAARQGAVPAILTVEGGAIPASGSVNVNAGNDHVGVFQFWSAGGAFSGTLAGVPGSITYPNQVATADVPAVFTRTTPGDPVKISGPRPFIPDSRATHAGKPALLWIGRNNMTDIERVVADYRAMVNDLGHRNIIIISELDGSNVEVFNDRIAREFPHYFIDLKAWLIANGLAAASLSPTSEDLADIAANRVPRSIMADTTHLNAAGYRAAAKYVAPIIKQKGWL